MVYIALSVIQSVLIFITFKLFDRYRIDTLQAIVVNYLVATVMGFLLSTTDWTLPGLPGFKWFSTSLVLGIMFIGTFFFFAMAAQKVGVAVTSVASKMSLVIPVIISMIVWDESLSWVRAAGILLAVLSFYLVFRTNTPNHWNSRLFYLPILVFIGNGLVDTTMKFADHYYIGNDLVLFLSMVFATSFFLGMCILAYRAANRRVVIELKNFPAGMFLGLINFGSTFYMLKAISVFESSVVFPVTNAAIVGLSGIAGYFGFREKLTWINISGIGLAIVSILIIAYNGS